MTGRVYEDALNRCNRVRLIPDAASRERLNDAIFDELCQGIFSERTTRLFLDAIEELKARGAECVILGCTEIPIIITSENSPLPVLDSTRLLARDAVRAALSEAPIDRRHGWLPVPAAAAALPPE